MHESDYQTFVLMRLSDGIYNLYTLVLRAKDFYLQSHFRQIFQSSKFVVELSFSKA